MIETDVWIKTEYRSLLSDVIKCP